MTTKELYAAIIRKPDLHSQPTLYDNILIWQLYKNAYVQAFCHDGDTAIDIIDHSLVAGTIMHWRPKEEDMIDVLYNLGKAGNILVLKKSLLETRIFYAGPAQNLPTDRTPLHVSKKKWDSGLLVYLEQK